MAEPAKVTLAEALAAGAASLGVPSSPGPGSGAVEYVRAERLFAAVEADGAGVSFRLAPAVAEAAIRTPDTSPSDRGRGWVILKPERVDGHAIDRATAWFESAWRAAAD
jgi:hypothetical protein